MTTTDGRVEKRYTFILKDELLPRDESTGREQATISWECDFELPPQTTPGETHDRSVFIPWASFNPTYRGKLKKDADPLDTAKIKRVSIMMRRCVHSHSRPRGLLSQPGLTDCNGSFFGAQEGDFSLSIARISALATVPTSSASILAPQTKDVDAAKLERGPESEGSFGATPDRDPLGVCQPEDSLCRGWLLTSPQTLRRMVLALAGAAAVAWIVYRVAC